MTTQTFIQPAPQDMVSQDMAPGEWEVRVDLEGSLLGASEHGINPAGFTIHSAVHAGRPEMTFVMHTHTPAGVGVATQEDGLPPVTQHALARCSPMPPTTTTRASP